MVDFDLGKHLEEGLSFRKIFKSIILYSISIFIAFWWSDYIKSVLNRFMPDGEGLFMKGIIGVGMTISLVVFLFLLTKGGGKNAKR